MKSKAIRHIDAEVRMLMDQHGVSYRTGFLAENPLRVLPSFTPPSQCYGRKPVDEVLPLSSVMVS